MQDGLEPALAALESALARWAAWAEQMQAGQACAPDADAGQLSAALAGTIHEARVALDLPRNLPHNRL